MYLSSSIPGPVNSKPRPRRREARSRPSRFLSPEGAYAVYAHLKPESLRVKAGDKVHKGQVLGLIGNSGISDAPHLHFHMMDSNSVFGGEGIPYVFEKFELLGPFEKLDSIPWEASKGLKPRSRKEVVKQYEIRWAVLDPSRGAEMAKTRPVVIVSLDELNGRPAEVAVDQIRTVSKARLGPRIGSLSDDEA